jgi:hypothetical protein
MSGPHPQPPEDAPSDAPRTGAGRQPETAPAGEPVSGFPEPPGTDPGDRSRDPSPHHALNSPAADPDPSEWPDPYDKREDPAEPVEGMPFGEERHPPTGATSTSRPHPKDDIESTKGDAPEGDDLDL